MLNFVDIQDVIKGNWYAADEGDFLLYLVDFAYFTRYGDVGSALLLFVLAEEGHGNHCVGGCRQKRGQGIAYPLLLVFVKLGLAIGEPCRFLYRILVARQGRVGRKLCSTVMV